MRIDVHQHLWSEPLLAELEARGELPFVRVERGLTVLYLAGERPYVIDRSAERAERRAALVEQDGLDRALLCLSSPIGIEQLPRPQALPLLDAYHEGALALGEPFGVWGAVALDRAEPEDIDRALGRGCVGISLPAGALARVDDLERLRPLLARLERSGAPLLVHPGPGLFRRMQPPGASLADPLWWPALTHYVTGLQSAWFAFHTAGRAAHPNLRVVFSMLAGLAPLHGERLVARGGGEGDLHDPLTFYEVSSYGPRATAMLSELVGPAQILYGSDRPVVEPAPPAGGGLDWDAIADGTRRALGARRVAPGAAAGGAATEGMPTAAGVGS